MSNQALSTTFQDCESVRELPTPVVSLREALRIRYTEYGCTLKSSTGLKSRMYCHGKY
jgi:hypothetical protein